MSGWPSGLRRQTQEVELFLVMRGVFWSTNVGVGSNPTSDKYFFSIKECVKRMHEKNVMICHCCLIISYDKYEEKRKVSTEPDLNQRPKDSCLQWVTSTVLRSTNWAIGGCWLMAEVQKTWPVGLVVWFVLRVHEVPGSTPGQAHIMKLEREKFGHSRGWFRSTDLWVMGPARFLCATLLKTVW